MMPKPLLITHPDCERHEMPRHPERPERLTAVMDLLNRSGLTQDMEVKLATEINDDKLLQVHPRTYIDHVVQFEPDTSWLKIEADTYMSVGSARAARLAAGACAEATTRVLAGEHQHAFCAIRPPGHHAELQNAMGFCLFNNAAVAAMVALENPTVNRVAILDFDVHHCNGTVDIFKDDARVLVCSSFQDHFYPHRYLDFSNDHIVTTPLEPGTNSTQFRRAIETSWVKKIEQHAPDFIFISAGFDAHADDPLAELLLDDEDYTWITELIVGLADQYAQGRIVSTLEGGYNIEALARSAKRHAQALL
ncbi:MAG: acetoin utilization deacetylase AcuC-like enzyme [Candidatus Azotimanducaceae bacterium]|jgi:acetoin utilization deacetylase AcuC-like enzyme